MRFALPFGRKELPDIFNHLFLCRFKGQPRFHLGDKPR